MLQLPNNISLRLACLKRINCWSGVGLFFTSLSHNLLTKNWQNYCFTIQKTGDEKKKTALPYFMYNFLCLSVFAAHCPLYLASIWVIVTSHVLYYPVLDCSELFGTWEPSRLIMQHSKIGVSWTWSAFLTFWPTFTFTLTYLDYVYGLLLCVKPYVFFVVVCLGMSWTAHFNIFDVYILCLEYNIVCVRQSFIHIALYINSLAPLTFSLLHYYVWTLVYFSHGWS